MTANNDAVEAFIRARDNRPRWRGVPPELRPRTLEEGYRLQKAVYARLEALGVKRAGYKVAAAAQAGQRFFGLHEPAYAGIFENTRMESLNDILAARLIEPALECEVAVVLGSDIDGANGQIEPERVAAGIAACHIACEIIDDRYGDPLAAGVPSLLVDDFFNAGFIIGPENPRWRTLDLAHLDGSIRIDDLVARGNSADILDAVTSVRWLAGKLAEVGTRLRAGEVILTGSLVTPMKLGAEPRAASLAIEGFEPLDLKRA